MSYIINQLNACYCMFQSVFSMIHLKHPVVRQTNAMVGANQRTLLAVKHWQYLVAGIYSLHILSMHINYCIYHSECSNASDSTWELYLDAKGEVLAEWKHGTSFNAS